MRIAVVGSRDFSDYQLLSSTLAPFRKNISVLVSGGARGADSLAEQWANVNGVETLIFKADWEKYGKSAGMRRNQTIIDNADCVVAFWDGESSGTANSISIARKAGLNVITINYKENEQWII